MKIGGEYGGHSKFISRYYFLEAVEKICPVLIDELRDMLPLVYDYKSIIKTPAIEILENLIKHNKELLDLLMENKQYNPIITNLNAYLDESEKTLVELKNSLVHDDLPLSFKQREIRKDDISNGDIDSVMKILTEYINDLETLLGAERGIWSPFPRRKISKQIYTGDIKKAIDNWAKKYNLTDPWVAEFAVNCLAYWVYLPDFQNLFSLIYLSLGTDISADFAELEYEYKQFIYKAPGRYDPLHTGRTDYAHYVQQDFLKALNKYMDQLDEQVKDKVEKTPETRNIERFNWLVRYQIRGESFNKIANSVYTTREAVTARVKETAKMCGITLRKPGKPGRPKKK